MLKQDLSRWTVGEIINDSENQYLEKGLYEKEEVDLFLKQLENNIRNAFYKINDIRGIQQIEDFKVDILNILDDFL